MPLLFLLTYIAIVYFIHKKNKDNIEKIPLLLKLIGIIAFALLFVFIVYYAEVDLSGSKEIGYVYSFYFLSLSYFVTYMVYFFKYKKILKDNEFEKPSSNITGVLENRINKSYFVVILVLSLTYFVYSNPMDVTQEDGLQILLYMFFIFSSIYILFENKILSLEK